MNEKRLLNLEVKVSYQEDLLLSLNDIITKQQHQIDALENSFQVLNERLKHLMLLHGRVDSEPNQPPSE